MEYKEIIHIEDITLNTTLESLEKKEENKNKLIDAIHCGKTIICQAKNRETIINAKNIKFVEYVQLGSTKEAE